MSTVCIIGKWWCECRWCDMYVYVVRADLSKLLIEFHLICKHADIVKEVWLHVAPHVRKPPKFLPVSKQGVVTFILFICT